MALFLGVQLRLSFSMCSLGSLSLCAAKDVARCAAKALFLYVQLRMSLGSTAKHVIASLFRWKSVGSARKMVLFYPAVFHLVLFYPAVFHLVSRFSSNDGGKSTRRTVVVCVHLHHISRVLPCSVPLGVILPCSVPLVVVCVHLHHISRGTAAKMPSSC
jgi:hypothetical protein